MVLSMVAGMVTANPARARADVPDGVADLLDLLGTNGGANTLASWTAGLGSVGKLAEPLPLLSASPGGLLGFTDLFAKSVTDELAGATDFAGLAVDKDITIDGGRVGHLTTGVSDVDGGKRLDVTVTVDKTVATQDLKLVSETPKVELSVADGVTVNLKARLALSVVWTGAATDRVYVVRTDSTPRLDLDARASIDSATAKAAIGILGVTLTGSNVDIDAHLVGTVSDPDGDGKLFFSQNAAGDGELAKQGSLEGLFSIGLDPQGSLPIDNSDPNNRGSVQATFQLGAAATGLPISLPTNVTATVTVNWPDIGTGSPSVSAPDLALSVGKFQNMSLQDLAAGLAQVITSITAIQKAKFDPDGNGPLPTVGDLDLPFMKGTLADAIRINEVLQGFLAANTVPAPGQPGFQDGVTDPAQAGQPTFTSLQDLLKKLAEHAGIALSNLDWNATDSKLSFTVGMVKQAPPQPVNLDPASAAASGASAQYGPNTFTVPNAGWVPNQWLGRRVTAGTSAGEVAGNTADTVTLKGNWIGGQPANNTPFTISGEQANVGAVTFANQVQDGGGHGIVNANADQTFAKVTPSFDASITLVLDLQDPKTGNDCVGFLGSTQACPFTEETGSIKTVVTSLPRNTDRVLVRTGSPLFSADVPIDTAVDLTANAGFFKVRLQGQLKVCNSSLQENCTGTATGHMLTVGLKQGGDAQHDVRLSTVFKTLVDDPASLLDIHVNARAYGQLTVSLLDAPNFLPSGTTAQFTAKWSDVVNPSTISFDTGDLSEIFKLDFDAADPKALYTLLIKTLQTLSEQIASGNSGAGGGIFDKEIPGLGKSLRDLLLSDESNGGPGVSYGADTVTDTTRSGNTLFTPRLVGRSIVIGTQIGIVKEVSADGKTLTMTKNWQTVPADGTPYAMRSALDDAISQLLALTPDNIQDAVKLLNKALGNDSVKFRYLDVNGTGHLVLDVDWKRDYRVNTPIRLDLGNVNGGARTFASADASGNAQAEVHGEIKVGLAIPLVTSAGPVDGLSLKVLEDSAITVNAKATLTDGIVKGAVGPLSIALGNPTAGAPSSEKASVKADLSLALAKPGATADTPVSFSQFIGAVDVNFNATNGTVDCGEGLDTKLMACATLPIYLNNTGNADDWTAIGPIALRVPDSTNPADLFDLDDNLPPPDATRKELEIPADLGTKLAEAILDFGNLGDGLDGYLAQIEAAFRLASFNGKLPLIGDDLQQGADFIGKLRTKLRESIWGQLPGVGRPADSKAFEDFINSHLAAALSEVDIAAVGVEVRTTCSASLGTAGAPTVTPTFDPQEPTAQWQYKVVVYQGNGNDTSGDGTPSAEGAATGAATLNGSRTNKVTWATVEHAAGYKILRKGPGDADFKLIRKLGNVLEYTDNGSDTAADYTPVGAAPKLSPCPLDFIDGAFLEFTAQRGIVSGNQGCVSTNAPKPCLGDDIPLDIGIPGLALRQGKDGTKGIHYDLGFALHFQLGLTKADGFFVNTHDGWGPDNKARPELQVGMAFDLPSSMIAELAFIKINVNKATGTGHDPSRPLFAGAFQIDLKSTADEAGCFNGDEAACTPDDSKILKFADLGNRDLGSLFGVSLTGKFHLDWILRAEVSSAFPGVRANFQLDWEFDNRDPKSGGAPAIAFKDVGINAGSFFENLLGDVIKEMKRVTGPIQPVIDVLYAPIPVLSDLSRMAGGGDVTLITLAKAYSTLKGGPRLDFVDTIKAIVEFINRLPTCDKAVEDDCFVPLGEFEVDGDKALTTSNSPTTADKMYKSRTEDPDVKKNLNDANDNPASAGKKVFNSDPNDKGDADKAGFSFPILDHPASAFNLLMGGDVTLVEFDSGPLALGFSWRQEFGPVYAPPPVFVTLAGSASVTLRIRAGLDTYGLRKAVEALANGTKLTALDVLDGLFFKTVDDDGKPAPVVTLAGEIAAGAAVSVFIIKVGIEGGLRLTIGFFWNDPNDDGKFRVSEFLHAALSNPLCLFTMSGRLSLFLRLYVTIGFSIFSKTFKFTLADVTLLDFSVKPDCDPPPPKLGGTSGDTLVVFAGKFGGAAFRGHPVWDNTAEGVDKDTIKVISLHYQQKPADPTGVNGDFDGFAVQMLGERREYLDPNLKRVVVDGTGYTKPMAVTFTGDGKQETGATAGNSPSVFDKDAVVVGGTGNDVITAGRGASYVDGRGGDDIIVTGDTGGASSNARVAGGAGNDSITVGNGDDRVTGDATLGTGTTSKQVTLNAQDGGGTTTLNGVIDWDALVDPTTQPGGSGEGNDAIGVGLGANKVLGNGGRDTIGVASDTPGGGPAAKPNVLVGGNGGDQITGGSNADVIYTAGEDPTMGVDDAGPVDTEADPAFPNVVDTGTGSDSVFGSTWIDLVTSHSQGDQQATLRGGGNNDVLSGGFGTDAVYGGPGDDYVTAEPAEVSDVDGVDGIFGPHRTVTELPLPTGTPSNPKTLAGGLGNDHVIGGDGPATIFGDKRIDAERCVLGAPAASDPVAESTSQATGDGNDRILGGNGVDTLSAGGANDVADLFGGDDLACGQQGDDVLRGGDGTDLMWGGHGTDTGYGDAGTDFVFGNDENDFLYGGTETDVLEGNDGADFATGGAGNDTVFGGTRFAGRPDTGDTLSGDEGVDRIVGDNGSSAGIPFDLDGAVPAAGGSDVINGGAGDDTAFGGLAGDQVNGNGENDHLEGNNGTDTVHGNAGEDEVLGGSFQEASAGVGRPDTGDLLFGDDGPDLLAGDNAVLAVVSDPAATTPVTRQRGFVLGHSVTLLDLGLTPAAGTSGNDQLSGGEGQDVVFGQSGVDRAKGDGQADYVEGGQGVDWVEGDGDADDLIGGSSTALSGSGATTAGQLDEADAVFGGPGDDVVFGDNGVILRPAAGQTPTRATQRLATSGGNPVAARIVTKYDLAAAVDGRYGDDRISGGSGVDVLYGQDGRDYVSGHGQADYLEGNGGNDVLRGDLPLDTASSETTVVPLADPGWPGVPSGAADLEGVDTIAGQDDVIGGSSAAGFRDGDDAIEGDGADDVLLGDNGSLLRTLQGSPGSMTEAVYTERYPTGQIPPDATRSRTHDPDLPGPATRFCTTAQATCEPAGAFGADTLFGDGGNDGMWGQDGNDTLSGGDGNDDMLGELGNDTMFGNAGEDAMLGDRGGVVNEFLNADDVAARGFTATLAGVPQESFTGFRAGAYDRRVDLLHDVDGAVFIGSGTANTMPHNGIAEGGDDRIRGGTDGDNIHAGFGDDLANGDSGGDQVFGGDGADVLWGGKGCDPVLNASTPDCQINGVFADESRGTDDRFVDHTFGGVGGTSAASQAGALGSDVIDFNPRGAYPGNCAAGPWPTSLGTATIDPCAWFEMTDKTNDNPADPATLADNQHHHGTDWAYGGWDRDVLQADRAQNGPNPGDRMMDWNGTYNLWTHCNASYGGFNDIRQHSPAMRDFLQKLAWATGAGQTLADVTTQGTSAFREIAVSYSEDIPDHAAGSAFPSTPGHFDDPVSCSD
jgi:Ca2+-binding RTX toxin-like protein